MILLGLLYNVMLYRWGLLRWGSTEKYYKMNNTSIMAFVLSGITCGITLSCSNPDNQYLEKIKQQVKEDALGVNLDYKNIDFQWIDTLLVSEQLEPLKQNYKDRVHVLLNLEHYIKDNFKKGMVFSKSYLTKNRFLELRNWELKVGHPNTNPYSGSTASWVKDGYKDYYQFAFANRNASEFIAELCDQIELTDELINSYDFIKDGDLGLMNNVLWFYTRIDHYESSKSPDPLWTKVSDELSELKIINYQIDSLSKLDPSKVVYYKAANTYKINNPLLNGVEQEIKKYFLFDENLNIVGKEEY